MSQENVEVARRYIWAFVNDLDTFRELTHPEIEWAPVEENHTPSHGIEGPFLHRDFECVWYQFGNERRYSGVDGLRDFMLDWTAPWVTYRVETEEAIDLGERVLLLNHDHGCREGSTHEVRGRVAAVFSIRDGKITRLDAYLTRAEALDAVGLER